MLASLFLKFNLLLVFACHVAVATEEEATGRYVIKYKYQLGDRQPHFGYRKGHMASDHKKRHSTTTTGKPKPSDDDTLNKYVVSLYHRKKFICSGLVVSNQTVLTTTLCLENVPIEKIKLKLLDNSIHKVHEDNATDVSDYVTGTSEAMITLLKLDKPLNGDYAKPPPICPILLPASEQVEVWDWNKQRISLTKKKASQISESDCKQSIGEAADLVSKAVSCVKNTRIASKCEKTHGLPYVWRGNFCGMNVFPEKCPNSTSTVVYARLLQVKRYISRKLNEVKRSRMEEEIN